VLSSISTETQKTAYRKILLSELGQNSWYSD